MTTSNKTTITKMPIVDLLVEYETRQYREENCLNLENALTSTFNVTRKTNEVTKLRAVLRG